MCLGSSNGWFDLKDGVDGTSQKGVWDLPEESMGPPRGVDGISQKGRWDLPEGSMGPPRRVDGTSQKCLWELQGVLILVLSKGGV